MCELLVFAVRKEPTGSVALDAKHPVPGDVIVVRDDGWNWGDMELGHPMFRILSMPGVPASVCGQLLHNEAAIDPTHEFHQASNALQYRGYGLDVAALADVFAPHDAPPMTRLAHTAETFPALIVKKAPVTDPAMIGTPAHVLG